MRGNITFSTEGFSFTLVDTSLTLVDSSGQRFLWSMERGHKVRLLNLLDLLVYRGGELLV